MKDGSEIKAILNGKIEEAKQEYHLGKLQFQDIYDEKIGKAERLGVAGNLASYTDTAQKNTSGMLYQIGDALLEINTSASLALYDAASQMDEPEGVAALAGALGGIGYLAGKYSEKHFGQEDKPLGEKTHQ